MDSIKILLQHTKQEVLNNDSTSLLPDIFKSPKMSSADLNQVDYPTEAPYRGDYNFLRLRENWSP